MRNGLRYGLLSLGMMIAACGMAPAAQAGAFDGSPSQSQLDLASTSPGNSSGQPGWGDMAGGVASRPYVRSLSVINGGTVTPVITDGSTTPPAAGPGGITAAIAPVNLCRAGQPAAPGQCYTTPNRVAVTVGYQYGNSETIGRDFANPSVPLSTPVTADTVIDMTIALNTLGASLRWSGVNGSLQFWQPANLGRADATVHVRFRPAPTPMVERYPDGNGCSATPIFNCDVARADSTQLSATMLLSLDQTLDPALTGAAFATENAMAGFLTPGGTAAAPTLDLQVASTHTTPDGAPQLGTLQAFIPAAALLNLYGLLPADASSSFTTTRAGDPGRNAAPTYQVWNAAAQGSDGLFVQVDDITFSVPKYRVASKLTRVASAARVAGSHTIVTSSVRACTAKAHCMASVYDLGAASAKRTTASSAKLVLRHAVGPKLALAVQKSKLARGHRYLLAVRSGSRVLASTVGAVR